MASSNTIIQDPFMDELNANIQKYFAKENISKLANYEMFGKIIFYYLLWLLCYSLMLSANTVGVFFILYLCTGLTTILSTINISHDAAHNVIFNNKKWNYILYYFSFHLSGYNPDAWKKNHVKGHHAHPNFQSKDPHFPETPLIRFAEWQPLKPFHQYQHIYAIILYCIHSVIYFVVDESKILLGLDAHVQLTKKQLIIGVFSKLIYLGVFIAVPILFTPFSVQLILFSFLCKHITISIIMTMVLGLNHFTEETVITPLSNNKNNHWSVMQLSSTIDFATENKIIYWLIGGFNAHALHHLFPNICHTHYRKITPIFKSQIAKHNITYHELNFFKLVQMHFKFLKKMGAQNG